MERIGPRPFIVDGSEAVRPDAPLRSQSYHRDIKRNAIRLANASLFHFMSKRQRKIKTEPSKSVGRSTPGPLVGVRLLSLEKCRSLLPANCDLSNAELESLRDSLYCLAGVMIDGLVDRSDQGEYFAH
jgi:hypothetical protein